MASTSLMNCQVDLTVPFHDLDPLNIVWHGNYLKYFDIARFALFAKAGIDLQQYFLDHNLLFPVSKTTTKHVLPLVHRDRFTCRADVREARMKIVLDFEIRRLADRALCCRGRGEQVAVTYPQQEILFEIPADVAAALGHTS
jgi:acyl-CoA thioester hydrolase